MSISVLDLTNRDPENLEYCALCKNRSELVRACWKPYEKIRKKIHLKKTQFISYFLCQLCMEVDGFLDIAERHCENTCLYSNELLRLVKKIEWFVVKPRCGKTGYPRGGDLKNMPKLSKHRTSAREVVLPKNQRVARASRRRATCCEIFVKCRDGGNARLAFVFARRGACPICRSKNVDWQAEF